jgi:effector-binding domain-containing protein
LALAQQQPSIGEGVPVDDSSSDVEILQLTPQPILTIRATVRVADLLRRHGVRPIGLPYVRYHTFGEVATDFELGVPVAEPTIGEGRVAGGELPAGPAVATWHVGPHDRLGEAYRRIAAWLKEHGRTASGPAWEVYPWLDLSGHDGPSMSPDASGWRTQLVQPIE